MASEVGKLEELALKRKERLHAMRERQHEQQDPNEDDVKLPKWAII